MNIKKYVFAGLTLAILGTLTLVAPAFADTTGATMRGNRWGTMRPAVFGTVASVGGNTITVTSKQFVRPTTEGAAPTQTTVTYTVDASNAIVTKGNVASAVSAIAIGDTISVQGTVTGTNVVATTIRDGVMMGKGIGEGMGDGRGKMGSTTPPIIQGNGQPVIAGTISAISGNSLTITNKSNVTYTVDATNAKIVQGQNTITISGLTVGDSVVVQGTVNGTSVTASSVIDQKAQTTTTGATVHKGFFGGIGSFFAHLFGF